MESHAATIKHFVKTPSGEIAYAERGSGPVALFVHGVLVNSHIWRHQLETLSATHRCISIDLLAHGDTKAASGADFSSRSQAIMLGEFLDALGIDQVDLVGNDGGGAVCQLLAVARPGNVRSLVLTNCDAHDNWPPEAFKGFVDLCAAGNLAATLNAMLSDKSVYRSPGALGPCYEDPSNVTDETIEIYLRPHLASEGRLAELEKFVAAFDHRQTVAIETSLKKLRVPTLVVWGDDDVYFDEQWGRWLKDTIPGARRLIELKGARLFFVEERSSEFNEQVRLFWNELTAK